MGAVEEVLRRFGIIEASRDFVIPTSGDTDVDVFRVSDVYLFVWNLDNLSTLIKLDVEGLFELGFIVLDGDFHATHVAVLKKVVTWL